MIRAYLFQSHNGAIAAVSHPLAPPPLQIVSIPQWCDCCHANEILEAVDIVRFNPTMVRLLLCCRSALFLGIVFQSHNGAIAA